MSERLKWMRGGKGFVAFIEGLDSARSARISPTKSGQSEHDWQWRVFYDGIVEAGYGRDSQAAADAANEAVPKARSRAKSAAEEKRAKEDLQALVDRQALTSDVPLKAFDIEGSDSDRLRLIISMSTKHFSRLGAPPKLKSLLDACSAELYRRRISNSQ